MKRLLLNCKVVFFLLAILLSTQAMYALENTTTTFSSSEQGSISGIVVDENGQPMAGVLVQIVGTANGGITDPAGRFQIVAKMGELLQISFMGYQTQEVHATTNMKIQMDVDNLAVDEVVVVGYGTQKIENLTGSVTSISSKTIEDRPVGSVKDAMQGNAAGVTITSSTGQPGTYGDITIRGLSSLNSGGALVLVDGMPSSMDRVNPNDIESISVLKDAAAAAIYGARAAEGVILITTKKGTAGKVLVEYSNNFSIQTPTRLPESTTGLQHAELCNLAFTNAGRTSIYESYMDQVADPNIVDVATSTTTFVYTADNNWIDMILDHSFQQTHNLSISANQGNVNYMFSIGWLDQNGMYSEYGPDNYDRYNARSNITLDIIKDKLTFDSKINYSRSNRMEASTSNSPTYMVLFQCAPTMPVYDSNGNWARYGVQNNPIQILEEGGYCQDRSDVLEGMFTLSYKPFKDLTLKGVAGIRVNEEEFFDWYREYGKYGPEGLIYMSVGSSGNPNNVSIQSTDSNYYTAQFLADYNKKAGNHEISALLGWSAELDEYSSVSAYRQDIASNDLASLNLGSTDGWSNSSNSTSYGLLSGFMRVNYAYDSRYLLEANMRADGSSKFSKKHRWGFFPSVSAGWIMTGENFMEKQEVFDFLKIRGSWGQLGNQNGLGYYDHISQYYLSGYYPFLSGDGQWVYQSALASQDRTWETVEMTNIGVDMAFLNNRLKATAEYYKKTNKDMLIDVELPSVIGISVPTGNYGELEVKGYELSLSWRDRVGEVSYGVSLNFADRKDVLVEYGVGEDNITAGVNKYVQGYSTGAIFGYKTDGYFSSDEEAKSSPAYSALQSAGDIKYIDKNGDGKITAPDDLEYLGTTQPRYEFGIKLDAAWRGFDVSVLFQGVGKRNFYLDRNAMQPFTDTWSNYSYTFYADYWTEDNQDALLPRLYAGNTFNYQTSDHWIQEAGYIRLKNLQVGYTFNEKICNKIGMEKLRVYFSGENLWESSGLLEYYDPEVNSISGNMYPIMRGFSMGMNVAF